MKTIFIKTENSKANEPHKFVFHLSQNLDLRSSNENFDFQNLSTYYTWKKNKKTLKKQ